jgi:hypothetical protein
MYSCTGNGNGSPDTCPKPIRHEWDIWTAPGHAADVSKAKIAHGTKWTTVGQSLVKSSNFGWNQEDVKTSPTATQWLEIFGRAINLRRDAPTQGLSKDDAIKLAASYMVAPSGLVLDVKSTYSSPEEITALVNTLKTKYGINVFGVGSFLRYQIESIGTPTTSPVFFYHSHYAVLKDSNNGVIKQGDFVMFNGGSLLKDDGSGGYVVDNDQYQLLSAAQTKLKLRIALYVQEPALSPTAVSVLINFANEHPATITDGFAYGNLNGRAESLVTGNGLGGQAPLVSVDKLSLGTSNAVGSVKSALKKVGGFFTGLFKSKPADTLQPAAK